MTQTLLPRPPDRSTTATAPDAVIEVVAAAELDASTVTRLRATLDDALSLRPRLLVLDMSGCSFVDATTLAALVAVHRQARRQGTSLQLRSPTERVVRAVWLCGLQRVFDLGGR